MVIMGSALLAAGCGSAPAPAPSSPPEIVQTAVAAAPRPPVAAQQPLPPGQVPGEVVGQWSGGEGKKTGEYLIIAADGRYARGRNADGVPYRQGVIVARGTRFVTVDVDGQQQAGTWGYTNAAGIEVLGVYFGGDYYSYARA